MITRIFITLASTAILAAMSIPLAAGELGSQGVSPGAFDRITRVEAKCPAFSWQSHPAAERYEIVVYRLDDNLVDVHEADMETATEVLYQQIPGRTTSWTPELADCFGPGERFAWFVRAVTDTATGEGSEWSEPRFFEVAGAPSADELERAIEVIRRWEAASDDGSLTLSSAAARDAVPAAEPGSVSAADSGAGASHPKSVITGTAAIRGEQPDPSGETYGVVGTSASLDGAGIGAANTAGGPDLVLDGAVPAEFTEAGVDRPSAAPQTFSFANTGGGGMRLDIDGVEVTTTATDQDTVGALSCAPNEIAKFIGGVWACASDIDTDTDTLAAISPCGLNEVAKWRGGGWDCAPDADTLAELSCGRNEIAKWNDAGSVWECAADNDTTYSLGPGLILDGGEIRIDPSAFVPRVTTIDFTGDVGQFSSIAIGADGLGLISYYDATFGDLMVAHCEDPACTTASTTALDAGGDVGQYTSIAIGADGLGLISYYDVTNGDLKVAHCENTACTTATISVADGQFDTGTDTSIAIGADGLGLISCRHETLGSLRVAHCNNISCTSSTKSTHSGGDSNGQYSSIAIGADGRGLISHQQFDDGLGTSLVVTHCNDINCSSSTHQVIATGTGFLGYDTSIAIGADGFGLVSYRHNTYGLRVAHCNSSTCSFATLTTLDSAFPAHTSIAVGPDGLGLISYYDATNDDLKTARCLSTDCRGFATTTLDSTGDVGQYTSIAIGDDGRGLISYYDVTRGDLKVVHLPYGY